MTKPTRKYLLIMRGESGRKTPPSPDELQAMFAKWTAWKEKFKDNIVDWGDRLKGDGRVVTAAGVSDGPFVEGKEIVGGFMVIAAESLDHAVAIAREMPGMDAPGPRLEIRELMGAKM